MKKTVVKKMDWVTFYFENRGTCPECGCPLLVDVGCIGDLYSPDRECSIQKRSYKEYKNRVHFYLVKKFLLKKYEYRRKGVIAKRKERAFGKNLDIQ